MDLRALRLRAGLTARELAERAGTSHSTLLAYEAGRKTPRSDTRDRIIRAAGFVVDAPTIMRPRTTAHGAPTGEELMDVLRVADMFPAAHAPSMTCPPFPPRRPA